MKRKTLFGIAILMASLPANANAAPFRTDMFFGFKICSMIVAGPWASPPVACWNGALEKVFG